MTESKGINRLKTSVEGQDLVIERIFNAPKDFLFQAFSESDRLASWWGPKGWETENKKFEFEQNGIWHYCMKCVDEKQGEFFGQESWGKAVFKEIDVPNKIVYTDSFSDKDGNTIAEMPSIQITLNFIEQAENTLLIIRSSFPSPEALQQVMEMGVVEGMSSQFECLDEFLAENER
ncbi:SRPBCC family protein [Niallia sp. 03091]|uniref:SRPBCC family protein n=1 Tax=unclassified Niallia TaxID=2837522 RepID=UPI004043AF91